MNDRAFDRRQRAPADNGKLIVFHRNLEPVFVDAGHLDFQLIGIAVLGHTCDGRDETFCLTWAGSPIFTN